MSKLIDKFNSAAQTGSHGMGFSVNKSSQPRLTMLLIATLEDSETGHLIDRIKGADGVLLELANVTSGMKAMEKISQTFPDMLCGARLLNINEAELKKLAEAQFDFVVLPANSASLVVSENENTSKILEIDNFIAEGLLRTVNDLPVEALLVSNEAGSNLALTWLRLMVFQRFGSAVSKFLLAPLSANVTAKELQAVWAAGVNGIIVRVTPELAADKMQELHQMLEKLKLPPRKSAKRDVLLPRLRTETADPAEEEEEEEEDW